MLPKLVRRHPRRPPDAAAVPSPAEPTVEDVRAELRRMMSELRDLLRVNRK